MKVEVALDTRAKIGESATWIAEQDALYWIDVKAPALHRYLPGTGATRSWPVTSDIGAFALTAQGNAIVALRRGIHHLDLDSGALDLCCPPPFDPALFRFNEGACDALGRFWVGVMFDPIEKMPQQQAGSLHSFTLAGGLMEAPDAAQLHNGMAWSADGATFYLAHSNAGAIYAYDYDIDRGRIGERRLFATIPKANGIPDGAAIDIEGGYWSALHSGGLLRRFHRDGRFDRDIIMPVSQPTMPAFASNDLATMYVTSASDNMSDSAQAREQVAGALFRLDPGVAGIARNAIVR